LDNNKEFKQSLRAGFLKKGGGNIMALERATCHIIAA